MADSLNLTQDQQDKVYATLYKLDLNSGSNLASQPTSVPDNPADVGTRIQSQIDRQKHELQEKQEALAGILSQEQLKTYAQQESDRINHMAEAMKMLIPTNSSESAN